MDFAGVHHHDGDGACLTHAASTRYSARSTIVSGSLVQRKASLTSSTNKATLPANSAEGTRVVLCLYKNDTSAQCRSALPGMRFGKRSNRKACRNITIENNEPVALIELNDELELIVKIKPSHRFA